MPAINPEKLAQEIEEIQQVVGNPSTFRWRIVDLFEFYSDRTRHSQPSLKRGHADKKYGIPRPVLNALERGLKQSLSENREMATSVASDLWQIDYREARYLAIALLEELSFMEILQQTEQWVMDTDDIELLRKLSSTLVVLWREENFENFSSTVKGWLKSTSTRRQFFALLVFQSVIQDTSFNNLPLIFHLLQIHNIPANNELNRPFHDLLLALIERSQAETTRFLLDFLEKDSLAGKKLIRSVLTTFPSDQQVRLKRALSA